MERVHVRPISPDALVEVVADRLAAVPCDHPLRVAVDGAPASRPGLMADAFVDALRLRGRPVRRVSTTDFLRPASVRLEHGREDPDSFYRDWLDAEALRREVLEPLGPGGNRRILPAWWDAQRDRSHRADYVSVAPREILLCDGWLLLGRELPLDVAVHLALSPGALTRRTPASERWTLPAFRRYSEDVQPEELADIVIRSDDPRHPALVVAQP